MADPVLTPAQARQSDLVTAIRQCATTVLGARANIKQLRELLTQSTSSGIDPAAFSGVNGDLVASDLIAGLGAFNAIEAGLTNADSTYTAALLSLLKLARVSL